MNLLRSGNAALDRILGGGFPVGSLVVVAGEPGAGKTVLAQQLAFHHASAGRTVRYYTTLSESHTKLVEHLSAFSFFDREVLDSGALTYLSVSDLAGQSGNSEIAPGYEQILDLLVDETYEHQPALVVLDSAKAVTQGSETDRLRKAVFNLASRVSHTGAVVLLVGEYGIDERRDAPEFAVADAILELVVRDVGHDERRLLRIRKLRGGAYLPGYHATRITTDGHRPLPRIETIAPGRLPPTDEVTGFAIPALDRMLAGGLPRGDITLVSGASGVGKTLLGMHFVRDGIAHGERCAFLSVEETRAALENKLQTFGWDEALAAADSGQLHLAAVSPVDLDVDELGQQLQRIVDDLDPQRIVLDGMAEVSAVIDRLGRGRRALWALCGLATQRGAGLLLTLETDTVGHRRTTFDGLSALFHNVLQLHYAEGDGDIHRALHVLKMRHQPHASTIARYHVGDDGIQFDGGEADVQGVLGYGVTTTD